MSALKDKNWFIRDAALSVIERLASDEQKAIYDQLTEMALKDEVSQVRASAVRVLAKNYSYQDTKKLFELTIKDKAPSVEFATREVTGNK